MNNPQLPTDFPMNADGTHTAVCAWCGQPIYWLPIPSQSVLSEVVQRGLATSGAKWSAETGWTDEPIEPDMAWLSAPTTADDSAECYEENPHTPSEWIVAQRAGSSNRTSDELAAVFVIDTAEIIGEESLNADQKEDYAFAGTIDGWCEDPDDSQALSDMIGTWESYLGDAGYSVVWDDGYWIYWGGPR